MVERRIAPGNDGGLRVRLPPREYELLATLPERLHALLGDAGDPGGVRARLFPPAYPDDEEAEAEYRQLIGEPLAEEKRVVIEAFAGTLERASERGDALELRLDGDEAESWLSALNDTRLALATLVGIESEEQWEQGPGDDPSLIALHYLGLLQEELLDVLGGRLLDE
ncbi:DUF2017 family protein [Egibacter rhizosphaerae]|uniref:DUF2017 family protein n=1 Tax=Egibacter rhizosphaerae TaxID=1670831 RepID=A0A411YCM7_9ACTN|nr:DUF2017 family protein [Egibacter rhizosphaerae]QBI18925.1 DUF2017 family protein [Egibacter rhizosphaerae]